MNCSKLRAETQENSQSAFLTLRYQVIKRCMPSNKWSHWGNCAFWMTRHNGKLSGLLTKSLENKMMVTEKIWRSVFCLCRPHTEHLGARVQQQVEEVSPTEAALLHGLCKLKFAAQLWLIKQLFCLQNSNKQSVKIVVIEFVFAGVLLSWTDTAGKWQMWRSYQISPGSREMYVCML